MRCYARKNTLEANNCSSRLHINIRSLYRNWELRFSFINVTETCLRDSSDHTDISDYNFVHNPRKDRKSGGVGLYLVDNFDSKLIVDYFGTSEHFCCEKVKKKKKRADDLSLYAKESCDDHFRRPIEVRRHLYHECSCIWHLHTLQPQTYFLWSLTRVLSRIRYKK